MPPKRRARAAKVPTSKVGKSKQPKSKEAVETDEETDEEMKDFIVPDEEPTSDTLSSGDTPDSLPVTPSQPKTANTATITSTSSLRKREAAISLSSDEEDNMTHLSPTKSSSKSSKKFKLANSPDVFTGSSSPSSRLHKGKEVVQNLGSDIEEDDKPISVPDDSDDLSEFERPVNRKLDFGQGKNVVAKGAAGQDGSSHESAIIMGEGISSEPSPKKDQSLDGVDVDRLLVKSYQDCVPLRKTTYASWSDAYGVNVPYSNLKKTYFQTKSAHRVLYREVTFAMKGQFVNLSRVDPVLLSYSLIGRYVCPPADTGNNPFVCLSVGAVRSCYLFNAKSAVGDQGNPTRKIEVIMISGEFERWLCALGHIYREKVIRLQIHANAISFATLPPTKSSRSDTGLFAGATSSPLASKIYRSSVTQAKAFDDVVAIYDARDVKAGKEKTLAEMCGAGKLPLYNSDLPENACVAVAYTVNGYYGKKNQEFNVGCNVQFVILLAMP